MTGVVGDAVHVTIDDGGGGGGGGGDGGRLCFDRSERWR